MIIESQNPKEQAMSRLLVLFHKRKEKKANKEWTELKPWKPTKKLICELDEMIRWIEEQEENRKNVEKAS